MQRVLIALTFVAATSLQAQTITGYRYWFDSDIAGATTMSVAPTTELDVTTTLPTGALSPGHHTLSLQSQDSDGKWSVPHTQLFTRSGADITGYRYWVNDNTAAISTGTIGPEQEVTLNGVVDVAALPTDFNNVTIQFMDADGLYSVPRTVLFTKNSGMLSGYEYWIDDAITSSTTGSIGPDDVVDLIEDLPTGIPAGTHFFTIRFSGANGTWTVPLTTQFESTVGIDELPGLSNLLLFPNPVTDELGLRLSADGSRTLMLQILDITGAVVKDLTTWSVTGTTYRNWDIGDLASGSYLLRIQEGSAARTLRFVKP